MQTTIARPGPSQAGLDDAPPSRHRPAALVVTVVVLVVLVDQTAKWWAWRHDASARINPGGNQFVGVTVGHWLMNPVAGALFDVIDAAALVVAAYLVARRPRPRAVVVTSSLFIAGWSSNLVDRLGMHYWTAPGSVRGVVDFLPFGPHFYNLADLAIVGGAATLVVSWLVLAAAGRLSAGGAWAAAHVRRPRPRTSVWVSIAAGTASTAVLAVIGALNYAGVSAPATTIAQAASHLPPR
ncbi:MAG: signal peptidase [Pseudonocardiales bacterium]|nr:signal peptidase [Pseudonocardiales bacterium]